MNATTPNGPGPWTGPRSCFGDDHHAGLFPVVDWSHGEWHVVGWEHDNKLGGYVMAELAGDANAAPVLDSRFPNVAMTQETAESARRYWHARWGEEGGAA